MRRLDVVVRLLTVFQNVVLKFTFQYQFALRPHMRLQCPAMCAGGESRTRVVRRWLLLLVGAFALAPGSALAADPAAIDTALDRAVAQLDGLQAANGSVGSRLAVRDTATAAEAIRAARPSSPFLADAVDFLEDQDETDVDSTSRAAIATRTTAIAQRLLDDQRPDGGFGLSAEYESDALDTALAIRALVIADKRTEAKKALDRLLAFRTGTSWGTDDDALLTSEALLAVTAYTAKYGSTTAYDTVLADSSSWLAGQQEAGGAWGDGTITARATATATAALASFAAYSGRVEAGADLLLTAQQANGSWGDPYSTALAVRALAAAAEAIDRAANGELADPAVRAKDVSVTPQTVAPNKPVTVRAVVTNGGQAAATDVTVEFHLANPALGGDPVATSTLPSVVPGGNVAIEKTFDVAKPAGRHKIYVVLRAPVDADKDLANNRASINLFVRAPESTYRRVRDWPRPGRDVQHSGSTPNRLHAHVNPEPIWRQRTAGGHTVAGGKVYFGVGQHLMAVDAKTGETKWEAGPSYPEGSEQYRAPIYNRGWVYSAGIGAAGMSSANGGWSGGGSGGWGGDVPTNSIDVIPVEGNNDPNFIYTANSIGIYPGNDCNLQPYRDPAGNFFHHAPEWTGVNPQYPSGGEGRLYFGRPCDGNPIAFAADNERAFAVNSDWISAFDPVTAKNADGDPGTPFFTVELPGVYRANTLPLVDSLNQVVIAAQEGSGDDTDDYTPPNADSIPTGHGLVIAVSPEDGSKYWSFRTDAPLDGSPIEYRGTIIVIDRSGRLYALDQTTGALRWTWMPDGYTPPPADQQGKSGQTLALSGRYLYVPHPDNSLYTIDPRTGTVITSTAFAARPYDLAIDDENNAIYIRTLDGWTGAYPTEQVSNQCTDDPTNVAPVSGAIDIVSKETDGAQAPAPGARFERPAMSADAKVFAWARETGAPEYKTHLKVRDTTTGVTTTITDGQVVDGITLVSPHGPVLSGDGRYLGFLAYNYSPYNGFYVTQPWVLDRQTDEIEPLLKNEDGSIAYTRGMAFDNIDASGGYASLPISISRDGRYFAIAARADLVPGADSSTEHVYIVDRVTNERWLASEGNVSTEGVHTPSISADGRYVSFSATKNLTGDQEGGTHYSPNPAVYTYDRVTDELLAVSRRDDGTLVRAEGASISGTGRYVAFVSGEPTLRPTDIPGLSWWLPPADVYVWDRTTRKTRLASINDAGRVGQETSPGLPVVSDDGQTVAFMAAKIFVKNQNTQYSNQIIIRDQVAGTTRQVSYNRWDESGNGTSGTPLITPDGQKVAFISNAGDIDEADTNGAGRDVFLYDRARDAAFQAGPTQVAGEQTGINCDVPDPTPPSYSDLNVTATDVRAATPEQHQAGTVEVDVRNTGEAAAEATVVRLYDGAPDAGGKLIGEKPLASLDGGDQATLSFAWTPATAGVHRLAVVVDPDQQVFEQDLADNEASRDVTVATPQLSLAANANKAAYAANETASFVAGLDNASIAQRSVTLQLTIRDADGETVATIYDGTVSLLAGGHVDVPASWNTQDTTAGNYTLRARVLSAEGDELKSTSVPFAITAQVAPSLTLSTSKPTYLAGETAQLRAIVKNESVNAPLNGSKVQFSLTAPGSSTPQTWELSAGDIAAGKSVLVTQDRSTTGLAPGTYAVSAKLVSSAGATLLTKTGSFVVAASSDDGTGVRGTLTATPTDPQRGTTITFATSVTNGGNADITGAKLRVKINDVETGALAKTVDDAVRTFGRTAPTTGSFGTTADMTADRDYQAALFLVLSNGTEVPLDRKVFRVKPAPVLPVTTGASFDTSARSGVLVWACDRADETAARTALAGTFASFVPDRADPRYANTPGGGLFTSDEQKILLRLLRSGDYNQIWLLGRSSFLELNLANEIAARVIHGDSLLIAGTSLGFDLNLFGNKSPLGASGNLLPLLPGSYSLTFPTGSPFAGAAGTIIGLPTALNVGTASVAATTTYGIWPLRTTSTLGTVNTFGNGKAVMFGASPKMFSSASDAAGFLTKGKTALQPAASAVRPGGIARLDLWVEGQSPGTALEVRAQLPAGASLLDKPSDVTLSGTSLTVPFSGAGTARRTRSVWVKLPPAATSISVTQTAWAKNSAGTFVAVSPPATSSTLTVPATRAAAVTAASTALNGVTAPNSTERAKLDAIKARVTAIATDTASSTLAQTRINTTLADIGTIEKSSWTNTTPAWKALATLVTYVEFDYYRYGGQ